MKICKSCKQSLKLHEFCKDKSQKDGLRIYCRSCSNARCSIWNQNNKVNRQNYRQLNKDRIKNTIQKWKEKNPGKSKAAIAAWKKNNPERTREINRLSKRKLRRTNVGFRIHENFSRRINITLKSKNGKSTKYIIDYTIEQLKNHLESLFQDGMTWDNYGHGEGKWTIDHKIPVSSFIFTTYECAEFRRCWALENLQPMWFVDNCRKGNRIMETVECFQK